MKVVSYDPYDTAGPSGPLSGTSCPPQPHLEVKRTPPFLTYLEAFPREDQSMKVVSYDPYNTAEPSGSLCLQNRPTAQASSLTVWRVASSCLLKARHTPPLPAQETGVIFGLCHVSPVPSFVPVIFDIDRPSPF